MREDTITALPDPNGFSADPLTDLIRSGARRLIEQALAAIQTLGALVIVLSLWLGSRAAIGVKS